MISYDRRDRRNTFEDELKVSRDSLGNHYFFTQCTELMFMWCTTPPLHNFSIFPNREIQRSFKHTVAFFFLFDRDVEMLALFVACLCHDIDHRGTTNSFQVSSVGEITVFVCLLVLSYYVSFFLN